MLSPRLAEGTGAAKAVAERLALGCKRMLHAALRLQGALLRKVTEHLGDLRGGLCTPADVVGDVLEVGADLMSDHGLLHGVVRQLMQGGGDLLLLRQLLLSKARLQALEGRAAV